MSGRLLHLYRPRVPSGRAQAISVVHTCHALAERGWRVTLLADRAGDSDPDAALAWYGLAPHPNFDLRSSPTGHPGAAGLWFRASVAGWWAGAPGVVMARDKRRLLEALRLGRGRHRVVVEAHELDSGLAAEAGRDQGPDLAVEREVARAASALVANCGGTLALWEAAHGADLPSARGVAHNGVSLGRRRAARSAVSPVVRYTGSLRPYKGLRTLLAAPLPLPLELVGGSDEERVSLGPLPAGVTARPEVPYPGVPDLLADSAALVLPLDDNLFGRALSSPLKLWDYLATAVPVVAPSLPSIDEIARLTGAALHRYRPGDPADLARAVAAAVAAGARSPVVRTWADRAAELDAIMAYFAVREG